MSQTILKILLFQCHKQKYVPVYLVCLCQNILVNVTSHLRIQGFLFALKYIFYTFHFFPSDKKLPDSPEWKKNCSLLMETPVHQAVATMREMENII